MPHPQHSKVSFREQMRGFPVWQMTVISIIRFAEPIAFTSMFPYVYFMIRDFGITKDDSEIATYSGYLAASFAFFQFLFCVQWGRLSDRIGRKPVLLTGLFGTSVSMLLFGFSQNFYMALAARSCLGALNGNIPVLRTAIGEVATKRQHQAIAFATLPLLWNFGCVVGPMLGGSKYLTRPKSSPHVNPLQQSNFAESSSILDFYNRFLDRFPYALSNIVVALFLWTGMILGGLFLEETHRDFRGRKDNLLELGDRIRTWLGYEVPTRPWHVSIHETSPFLTQGRGIHPEETSVDPLTPIGTLTNIERQPSYGLIQQSLEPYEVALDSASDSGAEDFDDDNVLIPILSRRLSKTIIRSYSSHEVTPILHGGSIIERNKKEGFNSTVFTHPVLMCIIGNFLCSMHSVVYSEFLPVLLAGKYSPKELSFPIHISGGFGYQSDTIGTLLSVTGMVGVLTVIFIYPYLDRHYSTITSYRIITWVPPVFYSLLPYLVFLLPEGPFDVPEPIGTVLLYFSACVLVLASALTFPSLLVLLHRVSNPKYSAFINGSALSVVSLARFVGPMVWGRVILLTEKASMVQLSWILLGLISALGAIQAQFMEEGNEDLKADDELSEP